MCAGAQRFTELVLDGAMDGAVIFRVVRQNGKPKTIQFGIIKDPVLNEVADAAAHDSLTVL